jgi:regulatory protein
MISKQKVDVAELLQSIEGKKISRLKPQVKDPDRISVFIDGRFVFGLSKWLAMDLGLKTDLILTNELICQLKESIVEEQIQRFFLNLLNRREQAANELYQKALRKAYPKASISKVIESLQAKNLQSDERYTAAIVRSKNQSGWGPHKIKQYLLKNRISKQLIENHISAIALSDEDEFEQYCRLLKKKKASWSKYDDHKRKEKIYRHLVQKGFQGNRILSRLRDLLAFLDND